MKTPKWTDLDRFPQPYVPAEQSKAEGYLAKRFQFIRESQMKIEEERKSKLRTIKK